MGYRVAVVGATGAVGREMLRTLAARGFPADEVHVLASPASAGKTLPYGDGDTLEVAASDGFDFTRADIALFSAGGDASRALAPGAGEAGCIVIDNSSAFRMDQDVPLVVPEVNADAVEGATRANGGRNIIANPNCSTAQLVVALKPLHDAFEITRVVVSTYQSVSGAGKSGMDELQQQTEAIAADKPVRPALFTKPIAFNAVPHIDKFLDDGFTKEEWKMTAETKKILDPKIELVAHCVRVPVFVGHSEAVFIETRRKIDAAAARECMKGAPGITVVDRREDGGYTTPQECAGEDAVFISRVREDPTCENGLVFWCVSDNLRKGAALNAVQIAELVAERRMSGR